MVIATLVIAIASSVYVVHTQALPCYVDPGLETTTEWIENPTTTTIATLPTTTTIEAAQSAELTTATSTWIATTTTAPTWCGPDVTESWILPLLVESVDAIAAATVFSCLFALSQIIFVIIVDVMILGLLPTTSTAGNVQQAAAPGNNNTLVHPCPNCSTPLQFTRTGPETMVQCFSCSATVEFATK